MTDKPMPTIKISLPEALQEYVEEQVRSGGYHDAGEYFRDLVRSDQKRKAKAAMEATLLAAFGEDEAAEAAPEWWKTARD